MEEINFNQIKRLWNLKLVVETGSIKRAATKANVTSSAMSQSISGLEESVGRKLLLRKKDELLPTEYGSQLLRSAESAFNICFDLQKNLNIGCKIMPKMSWLDFAATESLALDILPEIMQRLRIQFPEIRLKVKSGRSAELTKLVKKAELCMALVEENDFMEDVTSFPLAEERLGFYISNKLSIPKDPVKLIEHLGLACLAAGPDGHPSYFTKFVKGLGRSYKPTLTSESYEILRAAAVAGSVVAILPSRVASRSKGELVELNIPLASSKSKPLGSYQIFLVCEPGCTPEENIFLAEELKNIIRGR